MQDFLDKVNSKLDHFVKNDAPEGIPFYKKHVWLLVFVGLVLLIGLKSLYVAALLGSSLFLLSYGSYCILRILITKGKRKTYGVRLVATVIVSLIVMFNSTKLQTPEEVAKSEAMKQYRQEAAAVASKKAKEKKANDDQAAYEEWIAWKEGQEKQKAYDDQAAYEEWIAWKEGQEKQKAYDDQAAYEEWIAWKEGQEKQKAYDDQAAYEEWIAWKENNSPEALIRNNVYGIQSLSVDDNGDGTYSVVVSENALLRRTNDVLKYETTNEHKLRHANALEQCRSVVKGIQDSGVPVSDVNIHLIDDVQDGNGYLSKGDVIICEVPANADCEDIYKFQNYLNRFWMIDGL